MVIASVKKKIKDLTGHSSVEITPSGDEAIAAALVLFSGTILIPADGGWLSYRKLPRKLGLIAVEVSCIDAKIDLHDLEQKLKSARPTVFLYQNPGGYHAAQPMQEIYRLCQSYNCQVIMDVSGGIGTNFCDGNYADIMVGSFGDWKLADAGAGGFITWKDSILKINATAFADQEMLKLILTKLDSLPQRITFLREKRAKIVQDLQDCTIINKDDQGFVVVVAYQDPQEKEKIINYCRQNNLAFTECPRYIRINKPAISIELKRLH